MMPPTSIDGTDITGATIDGTDVQEITVDGDTVFSAGPENLPVAYSNLVAWYPFDSAEYGGSNADDVTAIIGGSGDDTAYDGTVNGATYQSSGGVTDINAGSSSGYYEFGASDDITVSGSSNDLVGHVERGEPFSYTVWARHSNINTNDYYNVIGNDQNGGDGISYFRSGLDLGFFGHVHDGTDRYTINVGNNQSSNEWYHLALTSDGTGNGTSFYLDTVDQGSPSTGGGSHVNTDFKIGRHDSSQEAMEDIEDVRVYDKELSQSEIDDIFDNTKPPGK